MRLDTRGIALLSLVLLLSPAAMADRPAADTGVLDVTLPPGATLTINGTDYGAERHLEMRPLDAKWLYPYEVVARFRGGETVERRVLLKGGWIVRLSLSPPDSSKPELVLETTSPSGPVAMSPDSRHILTQGAGNGILWDAATGRQLRSFEGHTGGVTSVAYSPDGRQVLTGSYDGTAILWQETTGKKLCTFRGPGGVYSVAFSPDGHQVLTGCDDNTATLWDVATGQQIRSFGFVARYPYVFAPYVYAVAFSPDGHQVLTSSGPNQNVPVIWDISTGQQLRTFQGHSASVSSAIFSPNGRQVLTGSWDKTAILWDVATGQQLRTFQGHTDYVNSVAFSPDGLRVLTGSFDKTAILWDAATGQQIRSFKGLISRVESVSFSPDGRQVLSDGGLKEGDGVILWDVETGHPVRLFHGRMEPVGSLAFSVDGRQARVRSWGYSESLWDLATGQRTRYTPVDTLPRLWKSSLSPDGQQVLGTLLGDDPASNAKTAILWDVSTGQQIRSFVGHSDWILGLAFSPDGCQILTGSSDSTAILWDAATAQKLRSFHLGRYKPVFSVAISPDGRQVMTGHSDMAVLWDIATGQQKRIFQGHAKLVDLVGFSPDGRQIFTGSHDKTVMLWDVATGQQLLSLKGHTEIVRAVSFSPDGRQILTGSDEAILWEVGTGRKLRVFEGHSGGITSMAFRPHGRQVLIGSHDGTARLWDVATGDEVARLISLGRDWLVVTPEGLFDGSAGGRQKVMYRIGGGLNVVPVDRFFQDFYRPGLLAQSAGSERPIPEVRISSAQPPQVRIVTPQAGTVETAEVTLEVDAADQGGGVANLAIYQNGARVLAAGRSRVDGKTVHRSFTIALVEGRNHLRIAASTTDGSWEAEPAELVLTYEKPLARSRLFLLAVGVNRYADANLNLKYAARDAGAFAELFRRRGAGLYEQVQVTTLLDDQATRAGIHDGLKRMAAETRPQDTLVLFLAGHGTMVGQRYYFVPHELRRKADVLEDDIRHQATPADELSDDLGTAKALKRMLILDTCASGGALAVAMKSRSGFALRGAIERLSRTQGIFTIAAASASEEAQEAKQLGHGVLSYALLAGLKAVDGGPLDGQSIRPSNPEGVVDVLEWFSFAAGQVPRLTEKLYGAAQDVQTSAQGASFPVLPLEVR